VETEAKSWSFSDMERVTIQPERVIFGITSHEQQRLMHEYSICLIQIEAWWEKISIQAPRKTIEARVIHS
jgi:hypothetical protein